LLREVQGVGGDADHEPVAHGRGALDDPQMADVEDVEGAEGDHGAHVVPPSASVAGERSWTPRRPVRSRCVLIAGRFSHAPCSFTPTMALPMVTPDPLLDVERRRALRRMRGVAVGLLLFAAAVYLLTRGRDGVWGFVNAGAEASMVGAIADWFAV